MIIQTTPFAGLLILEPRVFGDDRGYFMESYNYHVLSNHGITINFVQDNQSHSRRGVLRGLHYQNPPYAQTKLIRVLAGVILDVVVDVRKNEPTFGKHFAIELSAENKKQLLVPKGFAHGFVVLSETADIIYKCDDYYHPEAEGGLIYNDPALAIDWRIPSAEVLLSEKDAKLPPLHLANYNF